MKKTTLLLFILLTSCTQAPEGIKPVENFVLDSYLGTWYEIARLNHSFEKDLVNVTAQYSLRDDGGIKVINRGYHQDKNQWQQAEGKAYFVQRPDLGHLKVSFFGPFYGAYIIFELDHKHYQYALISGPDRSYFWLLSRTPVMEDSIKKQLLKQAKSLGFDTDNLIFPSQEPIESKKD